MNLKALPSTRTIALKIKMTIINGTINIKAPWMLRLTAYRKDLMSAGIY